MFSVDANTPANSNSDESRALTTLSEDEESRNRKEEEEGKRKEYEETVLEIAKMVRAGQCNLFLGSAVHAPSPTGSLYHYPDTLCPPFGSQLSELLATKISYPDKDRWNLQRVAWYFEWRKYFEAY